MEGLVMIAVLATDPIRFVMAAVAVILLRKSGLKSILIAGLIAALSMEFLMQTLGAGNWSRLLPALVTGVLHAGIVYGVTRLFGQSKETSTIE